MNVDIVRLLHQHLPQLYVFTRVAGLGSFQAAATALGLPRSSISKKVSQLEEALGQRLLQRSTRQLCLTDEGASLLVSAQSLQGVLDSAASLKMAQQAEPAGRVKISSSTLIGERYLLPVIPELRRRFPKVALEFNITDEVVDLISQRVDIAVRVGHLPNSSLVAKKIGEKSWACYAAPSYLARAKPLTNPRELTQHPCLFFKNSQFAMDHWTFANNDGDTVNVAIDDAICGDDGRSLAALAAMGLGVVFVDPLLIQPELAAGSLVPVLTGWRHPEASPIHLVCLGREARNRAVDAVWQYLGEAMGSLTVDG
ncbi:LysR family transcriptional regulator [Gilvimarinus sp. SDUM040013]|uniref:LysR family transcriptional regulator n=1 Tax=Gilvimarinus gilvus TaxID=3058038 RepID=A0ABU4S0T9_9GAMM|nr:LysR family transcriptional regulator [Gilvimarinus sp. SDUM040013]MDO3384549.1 LysR family transcriptional regulator [Gilvimarinus sp. SDUM040013]MDX6850116.1 LysR family transcriptional regulator [Gilvimarinus sp. SDUM040013]